MRQPLVIIGMGGHAKVILDILKKNDVEILGVVDPINSEKVCSIYNIKYLGDDEALSEFKPHDIKLVNAVGSSSSTYSRKKIFEKFNKIGFQFQSVIHSSAIIAETAQMGEGIHVLAGAIIQPYVVIGCNCIINTNSSVDHEGLIGDHVHIAPGVTLSGGVRIGNETHIGTGATVIQNIAIGSNCLVAAGAVITKNIENDSFARGVPAVVSKKK